MTEMITEVVLEYGLEHLDHFRFGFVPHGCANEDHRNLISLTQCSLQEVDTFRLFDAFQSRLLQLVLLSRRRLFRADEQDVLYDGIHSVRVRLVRRGKGQQGMARGRFRRWQDWLCETSQAQRGNVR